VDDFSHVVLVYLMHDKSQTGGLLRNFFLMVSNQFSKHVKIIRSDNGQEFSAAPMIDFYATHGVIHQTSIVDTPSPE